MNATIQRIQKYEPLNKW